MRSQESMAPHVAVHKPPKPIQNVWAGLKSAYAIEQFGGTPIDQAKRGDPQYELYLKGVMTKIGIWIYRNPFPCPDTLVLSITDDDGNVTQYDPDGLVVGVVERFDHSSGTKEIHCG